MDALLAPVRACPASDRADLPVAAQLRTMGCLVRYVRARAGLPPMRTSSDLDRAATSKIRNDLRCDEFTHTPCGVSFVAEYFRVGYAHASRFVVGENLAWAAGPRTSPRDIMLMWLHSPGHLRNLLEPEWRDCGLAVRAHVDFLGQSGVVLWASEFGARRGPVSAAT